VAGALLVYAIGIGLTFLAGALAGSPVNDPLARDGATDLARSIGYGTFVLLQRAAIGFAVAVLLRSQVAGVVAGIVLYIGESIFAAILIVITLGGRGLAGGVELGIQWFQFLPFSIGDSVLSAAPSPTREVGNALVEPVPLGTALLAAGAYLVGSIVVAMLVTRRAQISA
jgi:hypothetical protein